MNIYLVTFEMYEDTYLGISVTLLLLQSDFNQIWTCKQMLV
jgi:hypothetical protein